MLFLTVIDIIAIQEHRFYHPDDARKYQTIGSHELVSSSAWKNSVNASVGGVGFLLLSKANYNLPLCRISLPKNHGA